MTLDTEVASSLGVINLFASVTDGDQLNSISGAVPPAMLELEAPQLV